MVTAIATAAADKPMAITTRKPRTI